jgi:uncharacterized membrane protein YuzA (DUF378 family)
MQLFQKLALMQLVGARVWFSAFSQIIYNVVSLARVWYAGFFFITNFGLGWWTESCTST